MNIYFIYFILMKLCVLFKKFTNCLFELQRPLRNFTLHISVSWRSHIFRANHASELCDIPFER